MIVGLILGILTIAPLPLGRVPVEAWTDNRPDNSGADRPDRRPDQPGGDPGTQDARTTEATTIAVKSSPTPEAVDDYANALTTRRTSLVALLVGTLAVLLLLRWHLSVRGRQHYPRG